MVVQLVISISYSTYSSWIWDQLQSHYYNWPLILTLVKHKETFCVWTLNFLEIALDQKKIHGQIKQFILLLKMESKYPPKHPAVDKLRWKIPVAEKSSFVSILRKKSTNQVVINVCKWSSVHVHCISHNISIAQLLELYSKKNSMYFFSDTLYMSCAECV